MNLTHQHSSTEVKLVKELGDEDVVFNQALGVCFLHIFNDVSEPLPLLLAAGNPDEEHLKQKYIPWVKNTHTPTLNKYHTAILYTYLFAFNASSYVEAVDQLFEN